MTEKCSDTCQHKIKFVLTFTKNDLTLVEISVMGLDFCSDVYVRSRELYRSTSKNSKVLGNVRCPTVYILIIVIISKQHTHTHTYMHYTQDIHTGLGLWWYGGCCLATKAKGVGEKRNCS